VRRDEEKCWRCEVVCGGMRRYEKLDLVGGVKRRKGAAICGGVGGLFD